MIFIVVAVFIETDENPARSPPTRVAARGDGAGLGGGVAGAAAVCVANHLFPGCYTDAYDFAPELLLMCLVGAPVGLIALAFRSRLRWTVFFAFALSVVFVGWGVLPNFR